MRRMTCLMSLLLVVYLILLRIVTRAQTCTWEDKPQTAGNQADSESAPFSNTLDDCKGHCDTTAGCVAVDFQLPVCRTYKTLSGTVVDNQKTYSIKTCQQATTTAAAIATTPATTTAAAIATTPDTCTLTEMLHTGVMSDANFIVDISPSEDNCKKLCNGVSQCKAVTFGPDRCTIHLSNPTVSSVAGYQYAKRIQCSGILRCCFSVLYVDTKGISSSSYTIQANLESCKEICMAVAECKAVTFSGTTCSIYTSDPSTVSNTGSTLYRKSCPQGVYEGDLTIDTTCNNARAIHLSTFLILWCMAMNEGLQ